MIEYRRAWMCRILFLLGFCPVGLGCSFIGIKEMSFSWLIPGTPMLFGTILVWTNDFISYLRIYPDRIICRSLLGKKVVYFSSSTDFYHKVVSCVVSYGVIPIPAGDLIYVTINDGNKKIVASNKYKNIKALRKKLIEMELKYIYPVCLDKYKKGESIRFGPLTIRKDTITYRNKYITLDKIKSFEVSTGYIIIKKKGKFLPFMSISLEKIPNFSSFLELFNYANQHSYGIKFKFYALKVHRIDCG